MAKNKRVLITGITGFIAGHTAAAFLNAGYEVRGSFRSLEKADAIKATLAKSADVSRLEFVETDLNSDSGWATAMAGVHGVVHIASPFPMTEPKNEHEIIQPAVEGTLRVLKAADDAGVKRFVQTSSIAAIAYGREENNAASFSEADWSNLDGPGIGAYIKSKTMSEKAGRNYIEESGTRMHYSTVNPGLVLGPLLDNNYGTSVEIIRLLLAGKYPGTPKVMMSVVDVRDVATLHLKAMETKQPSGGRYIAVDRYMWLNEISQSLRDGLGAEASKAPKHELPNFVTRVVALFDARPRAILHELGKVHSIDNSLTRKALNFPNFISAEEATIASGRSLIDMKLV